LTAPKTPNSAFHSAGWPNKPIAWICVSLNHRNAHIEENYDGRVSNVFMPWIYTQNQNAVDTSFDLINGIVLILLDNRAVKDRSMQPTNKTNLD
jgi:hypothetical protein